MPCRDTIFKKLYHRLPCIIALCILPNICMATIFHDDFKNNLEPGWQWRNEVPSNWRTTPNGLEVLSSRTGIYRNKNAAQNTLIRPINVDGYVDISVRANVTSTTPGEQGGIIFYYDGDNYIKLVIEKIIAPRQVHLIMLREQNSIVNHPHDRNEEYPGDDEIRVLLGTNDAYELDLRLVLENNRVTMYWRTPGSNNWNKINESMPLPNKTGQWYAGLLTMWSGSRPHWQQYSDFSLNSSSVEPPQPPQEPQNNQPEPPAQPEPPVVTENPVISPSNPTPLIHTGEGISLNGYSDFIQIDNLNTLPSGSSDVTLSAWARSNSNASGYQSIMAFGTPTAGNGIWLGRRGSSLSGGAYAKSFEYENVWTGDDIWHHVAMTYNGTTARLFLDGTEVRNTNISWNIKPGILRLGRQINNNPEFWSGAIDGVRIYNKALTQSQIQDVMNATNQADNPTNSNDPSLVFSSSDLANPTNTQNETPVTPVSQPTQEPPAAPTQVTPPVVLIDPSTQTTFQAEDATGQSETKSRTDGNWWTGSGFRDMFRSPDSYVEWNNISSPDASDVTLVFHYTNGNVFSRPGTVLVNGAPVGKLNFTRTGSWSTVGTESINVTLKTDATNTIRLQSAASSGGPDFDKMEIRVNQTAPNQSTNEPVEVEPQPQPVPEETVSNPDPVVTEPETVQTTFQAEDASAESETKSRTDGVWWTGSGFKDMFRSPDSFVEWNTVSSPDASNVTLAFHYANGNTFSRPCTVLVNGVPVGKLNFARTGSWSSVGTESINVTLKTDGSNTIRLQSASSSGGPDFDKMEISVNQTPASQQQPVVEPDPVVTQPVVVPEQQPAPVPAATTPATRNPLNMLEIGFEQSTLIGNGLNPSGNPPQLVSGSHPVFEGNQSLSVFIDRQSSPVEYRTEFTLRGEQYEKKFTEFEYGQEYWIGFAIYLDDDYQMPELGDIIFQMHGKPDLHLGENYRNPTLALTVSGALENGKYGISAPHWVMSVKGDHRQVTPASGASRYPTNTTAAISPASGDVGRWVSFVIHFKHTYNPDGFMEIWKDGVQVYNQDGLRTAFNDRRGSYLKMGSYKWSWKHQHNYPTTNPARRQSYLDSLRIAQGPGRYDDVAP